MHLDLTEFQFTVLTAVVEGYQAREGLKDRMRALNEWEIARRTGFELSYAEFLEHPTREMVMQALSSLQQRGLIGVWERGTKYDSFVPTPMGADVLSKAGGDASPAQETATESHSDDTSRDAVVQRLDEVILLLRSIDSKLGGR